MEILNQPNNSQNPGVINVPKPKKHYIKNAISLIAGLIGLIALFSGWPPGILLISLSVVYFFSKAMAGMPGASRVWNIIGTTIASLFVVGGLAVVGLFVFVLIAFASWGGGGGSGK